MQNPVLLAIKSAVWGLSCSLLQLQCERTWLGSPARGKGLALHCMPANNPHQVRAAAAAVEMADGGASLQPNSDPSPNPDPSQPSP